MDFERNSKGPCKDDTDRRPSMTTAGTSRSSAAPAPRRPRSRGESAPSSPRTTLVPKVPTPELLQSRLHRVRASAKSDDVPNLGNPGNHDKARSVRVAGG